MTNRLIIVLGMHRSGTSVITKSLELMGIGLGANLYPAGFDNPKGFWENQECIEINDELLKHLGSAYDRLDMAWMDIPIDERVYELKLKAIKLISSQLIENNGMWGFKDPRTCRLLAFWSKVFLEVGCDVSFVLAIRNPASVVASLQSRNSIPAEKAYFLWLQHLLPSLNVTKGNRRVVVDYDEFLTNPYAQLLRISSTLDLSIPNKESSLIIDFESNFLDQQLRHTSFTESDLALDKYAPKIVVDAYSLLLKIANDSLSVESPVVQIELNDLNTRMMEVSPLFNYINKIEDQLLVLLQEIAGRDSQIVNLNQAMAEREYQVSILTNEIKSIYESTSWKVTKPFRVLKKYKNKV